MPVKTTKIRYTWLVAEAETLEVYAVGYDLDHGAGRELSQRAGILGRCHDRNRGRAADCGLEPSRTMELKRGDQATLQRRAGRPRALQQQADAIYRVVHQWNVQQLVDQRRGPQVLQMHNVERPLRQQCPQRVPERCRHAVGRLQRATAQ